ncbi:MAG: DUF350 domain-containing protein [Cyanobium sp.]
MAALCRKNFHLRLFIVWQAAIPVGKILFQLLQTLGWTIVGVLLVYAGTLFFDRLSPIDYRAEIRNGNVAAGLVLAAVVLGVSAIVAVILST